MAKKLRKPKCSKCGGEKEYLNCAWVWYCPRCDMIIDENGKESEDNCEDNVA